MTKRTEPSVKISKVPVLHAHEAAIL